jgi:O-acetyl-ADP-ribose deacetylase (regulator of RNase III)
MLEDSLQINLQERIAGQRLPVNIGAVFETPTSGLADRGVSFIFHVATVRTTPGGGYSTNASQVPICVANCFEMFDKVVARGAPLESILFPLIGAGDGSLTPREAANAILPAIVSQMAQHPAVKVTYVLAYRGINKQVLVDAAAALNLKSAAPAVEREPAPTAVRTAR